MVNIKRTPDTNSIPEFINEINKDHLCLPDFQREFVWKPEQCAKLIESVIRQYPIGALMFLNADVNYSFGKRSFKGTNPETITPKFFVIDGQQRLNTFYMLLRRPDKFEPFDPIEFNGKNYKIFFKVTQNLEKLPTEVEKPSFVLVERTEANEKQDYKKQGKKRLIPLEFVLYEDYTNKWIKSALNHINKKDRNTFKNNILKIRNFINDYICFIETMENELKPQDHYNIFQLLNAAGTDLTIFDLLVAKLNPIGIKLRKLWQDSQDDYPELKNYDVDPIYVLKTISLIRETKNERESRKKPSCGKADLMKLYQHYDGNPKDFESDWKEACIYLQKALKEMKTEHGVYSKKYIPYSPMIITLAIIKWWFEQFEKYDQRYKITMQAKIKKWYIGSILYNEYDARTDNKISEHYECLRKWIGPNAQKKIPSDISFPLNKNKIKEIIEKIDSSADARYKFIISLPLMNNAKDIYSNEFLPDCKLHDHHIFPDKYLRDQGIEDNDLINRISNRMLITEKTNQEIKKRNPKDYLSGISPKPLKKHFISKNIVFSNTKIRNKYDDFCEDRKEQIRDFIYELIE